MKNGGSEEELTNAIADLTKPTEFNEAVGALASLVPVWFAEKVASKEAEKVYGFSFEELYLDAGNNIVEFFGNRYMAQFVLAQTLKKETGQTYGKALSWDTVHELAAFDDEYREDGWKIVALCYLTLHEAERRHGEGGCTKKVFDSIFVDEIMSDDNFDKTNEYLESLTDEQCAYYQCLQEV
jgi:hypothetical protein